MQRQFGIVDGQSLLDVCLNTYGSLDYLLRLIQDNGIENANANVQSGQIVVFEDSLVIDQSTIGQNQATGIFYATKQKINYRIGNKGDFNNDFESDFNI